MVNYSNYFPLVMYFGRAMYRSLARAEGAGRWFHYHMKNLKVIGDCVCHSKYVRARVWCYLDQTAKNATLDSIADNVEISIAMSDDVALFITDPSVKELLDENELDSARQVARGAMSRVDEMLTFLATKYGGEENPERQLQLIKQTAASLRDLLADKDGLFDFRLITEEFVSFAKTFDDDLEMVCQSRDEREKKAKGGK